MIEILKIAFELVGKIILWMSGATISGFPIFWFLFGCSLLGGLAGWFFGFGELGGSITRVATKSGVKSKVKFIEWTTEIRKRKTRAITRIEARSNRKRITKK